MTSKTPQTKIQEELESLGESIQQARHKRNLTQKYVGSLAEVSNTMIAKIEQGEVSSLQTIGAVAETLGLEIDIVTTQTEKTVRASKSKQDRKKQLAEAKKDYAAMADEIVKIVKDNYDLSQREKAIIDSAIHITPKNVFYLQSSLANYYIEYAPQQRFVGYYSNRHKLLATVQLDNDKVIITSRNSNRGDKREEDKVGRFRELVKKVKEEENEDE